MKPQNEISLKKTINMIWNRLVDFDGFYHRFGLYNFWYARFYKKNRITPETQWNPKSIEVNLEENELQIGIFIFVKMRFNDSSSFGLNIPNCIARNSLQKHSAECGFK